MMEEKKTSDKSVTKPKGLKTSGQMKDTIHFKKKKKKSGSGFKTRERWTERKSYFLKQKVTSQEQSCWSKMKITLIPFHCGTLSQ